MSSIETITPQAPYAFPTVSNAPVQQQGAAQARTTGSAATVSLTISPSARMQSGRDDPVTLGDHARAADAVFGRAIVLVQDMKDQLSAITKQFPPFAGDDDERVRYLNNFSSLRKQVEALTFPPRPDTSGHWSQVRFPKDQLSLGIPALDSATASDEEVAAAEAELGRINADLTEQRKSLYDSVVAAFGDESAPEQARLLALNLRASLSN